MIKFRYITFTQKPNIWIIFVAWILIYLLLANAINDGNDDGIRSMGTTD